MARRTSRRGFLKSASVGVAGGLILGSRRPAWGLRTSDKLRVALIGVGERGRGFIGKMDQLGQNLVAVCDVDDRQIDGARKLPEGVRRFRDCRQMLDEMDRELDAVIVAT